MTKIKSYWEVTGSRSGMVSSSWSACTLGLAYLTVVVFISPEPFGTYKWYEYALTFKGTVVPATISVIPCVPFIWWNIHIIQKRDAAYETYLSQFPVDELIRIINDIEFEGDYGTRGRIADYLCKGHAELIDKPTGGRYMRKIHDRGQQ